MLFVIALVFSFRLDAAFKLPMEYNSYDACMANAQSVIDTIPDEAKTNIVRWACIHKEPTEEDMAKLNPPE